MNDASYLPVYCTLAVSLWLALGAVVALIRKKVTLGVPLRGEVFERERRPGVYWSIVSCYLMSAFIILAIALRMWFDIPAP